MSGDCGSELVGVGAASDNDDHARTIVPHEYDGDQMARQERQRQRDEEEEEEERRGRRAELAKPRIPELNRVDSHSVNTQLFE